MNAAQELLNIYPMSALAYERLGRMHERKGRAADALDSYNAALESLASRDRLFLDTTRPPGSKRRATHGGRRLRWLPPAR